MAQVDITGIQHYTLGIGQPKQDAASAPPSVNTSSALVDLVFPDAPSDKTVALSAAIGFESTAVQEPSVWYYNGLYHMVYTAGTSAPRLGYANSPSLLGPWAKNATAILGGGVGGLAGGAYHSSVYIEGTTGYIYFVDSTDGTLMKLATFNVATPTVVTLQATTWALIGTGTQWGNFAILKDGSSYICAFEQSTAASSWQLGIGTMTSPTSAITSSQFPCASLRPSALNATATTSAGQLFKENGQYVLFYHCGTSGSLPTYGYKATCSPTDLTTWTIQNNGYPIIDKSHRLEVDQVADLWLCQDASSGVYVAFWTAMNNVGPTSSIMYAPARPRVMQTVGGVLVSADNSANSLAKSNMIPQAPAFAQLAADATTTSASFVNFGITNLRFIPRTNRMLVRLTGTMSNTTNSTGSQFRVTDGGSINQFLASFTQPAASGGFQCAVAGEAVVTVAAGQRYTLSLQALTSGGTLQCRPATLPNAEGLTLTVSDLGSPNLTA